VSAGGVKRALRVAERVRDELALALGRDVSDPRVSGVIVSRVEISDDLQVARAYVRLTRDGGPETRRRALAGLRSAAPVLRKQVARAVALRRAPELRFEFDRGPDHQERIDRLLEEIAAERDGGTDE
jgi:ribosome-binding factor A